MINLAQNWLLPKMFLGFDNEIVLIEDHWKELLIVIFILGMF